MFTSFRVNGYEHAFYFFTWKYPGWIILCKSPSFWVINISLFICFPYNLDHREVFFSYTSFNGNWISLVFLLLFYFCGGFLLNLGECSWSAIKRWPKLSNFVESLFYKAHVGRYLIAFHLFCLITKITSVNDFPLLNLICWAASVISALILLQTR